MPFKNIKDGSKDKDSGAVVIIGKGVLLAYVISALLLIVYGILLTITSLSESSMSTIVMIITMISIALSSIYSAMKAESKGWLHGAVVGLIYMILLFLIGLIFDTGLSFDSFIIFRLFMGLVIGALSGIIGINLK